MENVNDNVNVNDSETLAALLAQNEERLARFSAPFDPISGRGSIGERFPLSLPDFAIPLQFLPVSMRRIPLVRRLLQAGSISAFLDSLYSSMPAEPRVSSPSPLGEGRGGAPSDRAKVADSLIRLRFLHDFPFWAASVVYIKNKGGGEDVLFRLRFPQRLLVEAFERRRLAGQPIRLVLLKARQWGGSTTTQLYMAWLQLFHLKGLNSLIVAHQGAASDEIKDMFDRMISRYPIQLLYPQGEPFSPSDPKIVPVGKSGSTQRIPQRNCKIKIGTAERPDGCRGGDYSLVHLSEVGIWKKTDGKSPEDIVRSACSGVLLRPLTMIVLESTANGVGNFFHSEYLAAADPAVPSQFDALFIPWFLIEQYSLPFDSPEDREEFARSLIAGRSSSVVNSSREEPGRFLWSLWQKGATLEAINWYVRERAGRSDHALMAAEFPSDDVEAFVHSGSMVFDRFLVEALAASCRPPRFIGEISAPSLSAPLPSRSPSPSPLGEGRGGAPRFIPDARGALSVWALPHDADSPEAVPRASNAFCPEGLSSPEGGPGFSPAASGASRVEGRYLCVVDVGGRSSSSDFSVIAVFDRINMIDGDRPVVVAQWYGHCDIDILAWKAAQIAAFYDNALLVIESNTLETRDRERSLDGGDQSLFILNQISSVYPNLYARRRSEDEIRQGVPRKYGFHTNVATKPMVISTLVRMVREGLYVERDRRAIDELLVYERKPNGAYGAIAGRHDDILMTRAIGLHICFFEMEPPRIIPASSRAIPKKRGPVSEASF